MFDNHVHTNLTKDSDATLEELVSRAKEIKLERFTVTNHYLIPKIDLDGWQVNEKHFRNMERKAKRLSKEHSINIKTGIEIDFSDSLKEQKMFKNALKWCDYDIVLVACHFVGNVSINDSKSIGYFEYKGNIMSAYAEYFQKMERCVDFLSKLKGEFCLAHFDVIKRHGSEVFALPDFDNKGYFKMINRIAKKLKKAGNIGIELNVRGYDHHAKEPYPNEEILELFCEKGIKKITIGSDCHCVEHLGMHLGRGVALLKEAGFNGVYDYAKRKPVFVSFEEFLK